MMCILPKNKFNSLFNSISFRPAFVSVLFLFLFFTNSTAQTATATPSASVKKTIYCGIGVEFYGSGDALGGFYSGYLSISRGKGAFTIGPCIQKRSMQMRGGKIGFLYKIVGLDPEDKGHNTGAIGLKLFSYLQFTDQLPLSYAASTSEMIGHNNSDYDWNSIKLSTGEFAVGIEFHIRIAAAVTWKSFLGVNTSYHFNYIQGMYNDRVSPTLVFGTGINIPRFKM